jgi:hypothetical protein
MLVYVDDFLIISSSLTLIARIKTKLQVKFVIADLGLATHFRSRIETTTERVLYASSRICSNYPRIS